MTNNKRISKIAKRALILFIVALTVIGTVACSKPPIQTGVLEEGAKIDIEGNITFTISNESGTASEAAAVTLAGPASLNSNLVNWFSSFVKYSANNIAQPTLSQCGLTPNIL